MASDFDKLFGDDWRPQDPEPGGSSGRGPDGESSPLTPESFSGAMDDRFSSETENRTPRSLNEKEIKVVNVYVHQEQGAPAQHFVLLRDNKGRRVPIWVGQFEAWAIMMALEGEAPDRPMTHDLIKLALERLDVKIERITIDDLWNDTFYAKINVVRADGSTLDIDARPSDAIAVAVRAHAPIYMAEAVLEATVRPD
ncbi:hypothetical protein CCAX7_50710 [Capsulimonas corticalis]|uniref:Uncharacterized protein n=1 Tax=Capsulimonas corticalis TaxID=2219043 RepID=A0A402CPK4_9BACT|nr:bifunctional nuclease family protein [Capsulimonas corticalis]BDI33020.1 hypothetical protein CCAX7_50710 [Capsulimonas corticalis]